MSEAAKKKEYDLEAIMEGVRKHETEKLKNFLDEGGDPKKLEWNVPWFCYDSILSDSLLVKKMFCSGMSGCKQLPFLTLERLDCYPKTFDVALESKCEVDIPNESGDYPLHIHAGNPEYVRKLLVAGAFVDCKNKNDMTPLHIAASKGVVESVYWLLLNGADVAKQCKDGICPLYYAVKIDCVAAAILILNERPHADQLMPKKTNFLHLAAQEGSVQCVLPILEIYGMTRRIDAEDDLGNTPLHYAVSKQRYQIVISLLRHGAGVLATNKVGKSPLDFAVQAPNGFPYFVAMAKRICWPPEIVQEYRIKARDAGNREVLEYLEKKE